MRHYWIGESVTAVSWKRVALALLTVIGVVCAVGVATLVVAVLYRGPTSFKEVRRSPRPGTDEAAFAVEEHHTRGLMSDEVTSVFLASGGPFDQKAPRKLLWSEETTGIGDLTWRGPDSLDVVIVGDDEAVKSHGAYSRQGIVIRTLSEEAVRFGGWKPH